MRVGFQFAALSPIVGIVVVGYVAEQKAARPVVDDDSEVEVDSDRGEVGVFGTVEFMELEAGVGGIELEIEGGGFDELLFLVGEAGERVGESIGKEEIQTFSIST